MTEGNVSEASNSHNQVLAAHDLQKSYGQRPALRGLSFSLKAGRVLGFLGPNGAGKTTSIRILSTILEPDAGHFVVDGIASTYPERIRSPQIKGGGQSAEILRKDLGVRPPIA